MKLNSYPNHEQGQYVGITDKPQTSRSDMTEDISKQNDYNTYHR